MENIPPPHDDAVERELLSHFVVTPAASTDGMHLV